jgi:NADH-quinone oxidoreductase subunit L
VASGFSRKDDAHDHGHSSHGHDPHEAPWSMALPLILLAVGSIFAGYVGVPHALGGSNRIESFLEPSFEAHGAPHATAAAAEAPAAEPGAAAGTHAAEETHADVGTERLLMGISIGVAFAGIFIAMYFWLRNRSAADRMAQSFGGLYRLLLDKYRIDELYDAMFVQPIKLLSTMVLWRGIDAGMIDGAVNGVGAMISGSSSALRRMQTGSVRTYAFALFAGAVAILGYYLFR